MIVTILAWTGAFLSCLLTIPQAVRTLRSDQLDGLSATTYWIIFGNAAVWASVVGSRRRIRRRRAFACQRSGGVADPSPAASQPAVGRASATHLQPSEPRLPLQPAPSLSVSACP